MTFLSHVVLTHEQRHKTKRREKKKKKRYAVVCNSWAAPWMLVEQAKVEFVLGKSALKSSALTILGRANKISSFVGFCRFNSFFQLALHTVRFRIERCLIYPKSSCLSVKPWSSERRLGFYRLPTCMCYRRRDALWAQNRSHGFSALSMYAHQASLPAASWVVLTSFCNAHASRCSVLNTAHVSLLGPHTTTSFARLWFYWPFPISLDFSVHPLHILFHLKTWSRLSESRTGLPQTFSHDSLLSHRRRLVYQNLCRS